jgi:hypothetical protein
MTEASPSGGERANQLRAKYEALKLAAPTPAEERCPHGHRYGVDANKFDDCEECAVWEPCDDAADLAEKARRAMARAKAVPAEGSKLTRPGASQPQSSPASESASESSSPNSTSGQCRKLPMPLFRLGTR